MMGKRESFASDIVVSVWRKKSPGVRPGLERILETGGFARIRGDNGRAAGGAGGARGGREVHCTGRIAVTDLALARGDRLGGVGRSAGHGVEVGFGHVGGLL